MCEDEKLVATMCLEKFERESFEISVGNENVIALLSSYKLHLLLQNTVNTVKIFTHLPCALQH